LSRFAPVLSTMSGTTTTRTSHLSEQHRAWVWHGGAILSAVTALLLVMKLLELPAVVDRMTIDNPTADDVSVYVAGRHRDGWMAVGIVQHETTYTFEQVIDQGDVWIFRFAGPGERGELQITRRQLESDQWRVRVPPRAGEGVPG
jgi:hypothetical protein